MRNSEYICKIDMYINIFMVETKTIIFRTCVPKKSRKKSRKKRGFMKQVNICKIDMYINIFMVETAKTTFSEQVFPKKVVNIFMVVQTTFFGNTTYVFLHVEVFLPYLDYFQYHPLVVLIIPPLNHSPVFHSFC